VHARKLQESRLGPGITNATAPVSVEQVVKSVGRDSVLCDQIDKGVLSGRGVVRTWKVARTLADLEAADEVTERHILQALVLKFDGFEAEAAA
jgi:predicted ATPase with chaperone activity